ncbi:MAG TPA: metallophosphoesterase [Myxococcota bacterium]|nr:metallophosphoesterase [Myxococcota bacterium]
MTASLASNPSPDVPDFVLVSDLHMGQGRSEDPPRYSPMEEFFYDESFARLLQHLQARYGQDPDSLVLVINGDAFDFLTMTRIPDPKVAAEYGFEVRMAERRFGLNPTPRKSVYGLDQIVAGHPIAIEALARFVAAGFQVEILRGNHDLELFFEPVQQRLREHLTRMPGGPSPKEAAARVRFHQWFLLIPGRLYIEHGNQYESSNSIRYPLRPVLSTRQRRGEQEDVLDYPLGSIFVRYFYNSVHRINPYQPKLVSFEQYLDFLRSYNLLDLLRIARGHYPFFIRTLRPNTTAGSTGPSREDDAQQADDFRQASQNSELPELHQQLNQIKVHPASASKLALVQAMTRPIFKRVAWFSATAFGALYVWLLIFSLIQATPWLAENVFAKAVLMAVLAISTLAVLIWLVNYLGWRLRRQHDSTAEMLAERADRIARLTGVKLVLMGHTHLVDARKVADGRATYANSGTWVAVDNPWERIDHDARRFTLLLVQGDRVQVSRWNDNAGRIETVPMFDLPPAEETARGERTAW